MRVKVIIENGETTILLTPQNEFEIDIIEKIYCKKQKHTIFTSVDCKYQFGTHSEHKIEMSIKEEK